MSKNFQTLITTEEINRRVMELGQQISSEYQGKDLVVVGVLKGSFIFMSDLVRQIEIPLRCDFLRVSSYEKNRSTGVIRMEFDMTQSIEGKDVLLVEDIVDTGSTLKYLLNHMASNKPASLKVCSLLYKEVNPEIKEKVDYIGFTIPIKYVVGYGLDDEGLYRSLPYIGCV